MTPSSPMSAAFLGHGSPMNAIESNRFTTAWRNFGAGVPKPRGILMISAHWYPSGTAVTAMPHPRTIHDFFGFPEELFAVRYPAPGSLELAAEVAEIAKPTPVGMDRESWGLDHGAWSVLVHAFPEANIPVVQLSIDQDKDFDFHFALGSKLAALRRTGVLIVASGNVVHNLRVMERSMPELGFDWAYRFNDASRLVMTEKPEDAPGLQAHPDFPRAAPTPEHFMPLLYLAGIAAVEKRAAKVLVDGCAFGSISMASYELAG